MGQREVYDTLDELIRDALPIARPDQLLSVVARMEEWKREDARRKNPKSGPLDAETVREIRRLYRDTGLSLAAIGTKFWVHPQTVANIVNGKTYKHV